MSIINVYINSIILHVSTGLVFQVRSVGTGQVNCIELYGPNEGRPATVLLHQLAEFREIGRVV